MTISNSSASKGAKWSSSLFYYNYLDGNGGQNPEKYGEEDLERLMQLIEESGDKVTEICLYKTKLSPILPAIGRWRHEIVVFKTDKCYFSIEKTNEGIVLQRGSQADVILKREASPRKGKPTYVKDLHFKGELSFEMVLAIFGHFKILKSKYNLVLSNCQHFSVYFQHMDGESAESGFVNVEQIRMKQDQLTESNLNILAAGVGTIAGGLISVVAISVIRGLRKPASKQNY